MYDYTNGNSNINPIFDVFFQNRVTNTDYGITISAEYDLQRHLHAGAEILLAGNQQVRVYRVG